ncbi:hypothetical protein R6Y99_25505 [Pseudomonas lundensis]|uniref:hypothetical protein n=1 Tax=Serratia proteamaculans TaxID=28151 RepID=UPI0029829ACC|nr:hypothetical protein [Serratia proteamaculans]MDW5503165.1 hypothetical protein [Serratia proteamaculans]MDW5508222.1 hypothetical protein [Pseudomonas lundensis]
MQKRKQVVPFSVVICLEIIPAVGEDNSTKKPAGESSAGETVSHDDAFYGCSRNTAEISKVGYCALRWMALPPA